MNSYDYGATITLSTTFPVDGVLTDPTAVTLRVRHEEDAVTTYTYGVGVIAKDATGTYHADIQFSLVGLWHYRWEGTGAAAGVKENTLRINPSKF